MSEKSNISWTDATWSPVTGCDPISAGCKNCYAKREVEQRWSKNPKSVFFGRAFNDVQCHESALSQPLHWKNPKKIFVCPRADLFHEAVPDEWIDKVFAVMALASQHTFQVLTKRPERMRKYLTSDGLVQRIIRQAFKMDCEGGAWMNADHNIGGYSIMPLPNAWIGVSVEDQAAADDRIPILLNTPAAVRWISAEPLLGPIDLERSCDIGEEKVCHGSWTEMADPHRCLRAIREGSTSLLDWVVVGGESGKNARPMSPDLARSLRDQCAAASVPFLFKQWGEWIPMLGQRAGVPVKQKIETTDGWVMGWAGTKAAGRLLDGVLHDAYPKVKA